MKFLVVVTPPSIYQVAPCELLAVVPAFARPGGRAHGGAGQVPGAAAAPLDQLADLYERQTTHRRTYIKLPL